MGFFLGGTELDVAGEVIAAVRALAAKSHRSDHRTALELGLGKFRSVPLKPHERAIVDAAVEGARALAVSRAEALRGGRCYQVARALVEADTTGKIHYVEGFYRYTGDTREPVLHGWVTINGKLVDLFGQNAPVYGEIPPGAGYAGHVFARDVFAYVESIEGALPTHKGRLLWRSVTKLVTERRIPRP